LDKIIKKIWRIKARFLSWRGLSKTKEEFENLKKMKLLKMAEEAPKMTVSGNADGERLDCYRNIDLIEVRLKSVTPCDLAAG